ncbi:7 transmembrane receptor (rhodopsin family) domain-containing protein [Ditylenchus destructor]|nr:7 transmembrane receptor (rhodopsin family) domain-containing protein [Ditylenchus destructor]
MHPKVFIRFNVPTVFAGCSEYRGPDDDKYATCEIEPGKDRCELLQELHQAKDFRKYFLALVPLILSFFAIILNVIVIISILTIILRLKREGSKKRYLFVISRSCSVLIALLFFYVVLIAWKLGGFNYFSAAIFLFVGMMSFSTSTGTYLSMTILLYIAVVHPLAYKKNVTMPKCLTLIAAIWTISVGSSILVGVFGATLFYPQTAPITCEYDSCQFPLAVALVVILNTSYIAVIGCYVGMVVRMHLRTAKVTPTEKCENIIGSTKSQTNVSVYSALNRNIRAMNRLAAHLITFTVSKSPLLAVSIVALINLSELRILGLGHKTPCKTYEKGRLFFQVELLASLAAIIWLLGMVIDPLICIFYDQNIYKFMKQGACKVRYMLGRVSQRQLDALRKYREPQLAQDDSAEF